MKYSDLPCHKRPTSRRFWSKNIDAPGSSFKDEHVRSSSPSQGQFLKIQCPQVVRMKIHFEKCPHGQGHFSSSPGDVQKGNHF